ncbi:unnamed protein product [Larinioides sclopetarius]|uniref:Uncharacterized protein n=1 Tax=Larinioides sclopetarius TaxID=280406 RepID=A0AAV2A0R8_9ARAC
MILILKDCNTGINTDWKDLRNVFYFGFIKVGHLTVVNRTEKQRGKMCSPPKKEVQLAFISFQRTLETS